MQKIIKDREASGLQGRGFSTNYDDQFVFPATGSINDLNTELLEGGSANAGVGCGDGGREGAFCAVHPGPRIATFRWQSVARPAQSVTGVFVAVPHWDRLEDKVYYETPSCSGRCAKRELLCDAGDSCTLDVAPAINYIKGLAIMPFEPGVGFTFGLDPLPPPPSTAGLAMMKASSCAAAPGLRSR